MIDALRHASRESGTLLSLGGQVRHWLLTNPELLHLMIDELRRRTWVGCKATIKGAGLV